MSQNREEKFVNTEIWKLFRKKFKSETTEASYWSDIHEFCRIAGKPFTESDSSDVKKYYDRMSGQIKNGKLSKITLTKKFRELHSFASFLMEQGIYLSGKEHDYFYPYLKTMAKESALAGSVPVEDMDALLNAASDDIMAYTILTLMYRAGMTSTEIIGISGEGDFAEYDDGVYAMLSGREEPCYIPDDAWTILKEYMDQRMVHDTLFYNRSGRPLNTMFISRMMKKYCSLAGIQNYSAQAVRNSCAFNMFAYGATDGQTARQMGRTEQQIRRYRGSLYRRNLQKQAADLVKIHIEKP